MGGLVGLLIMSALLGVGAFAIGMLPLLFAFSKSSLAKLSTFGTGLLLGTALGVIIPEGVETIVTANTSRTFPSKTIALALIGGFKFMLVVERLVDRFSPGSHDHSHHVPLPTSETSSSNAPKPPSAGGHGAVVFDVELGELERSEGITSEAVPSSSLSSSHSDEDNKKLAYPLTLGLLVHALADGLALGSSAALPVDTGLSFVVFLALVIHKAPTSLALTTSLLSTSLSRSDCRKHLAVFSAATPIGAVICYGLMSFVKINSESNWTGVALLISGGTFLYVATVIQPGKAGSEGVSEKLRFLLVIAGMLLPLGISAVFEHEH